MYRSAAQKPGGLPSHGIWGREHKTPAWFKVVKELIYVTLFLYAYEYIRDHVVQSAHVAIGHALTVVHIEQDVGLFQERRLQSVLLHWPWIFHVLNPYYGGTHFLVPAVALVWLAVRHPDRYYRARNVLAVTTAAAFTFFWLCPVAPPRMLPARYGIVDTLRHLGGGHVEMQLIDRAGDAYAAMPSLHCAWALWCTLALYPVLRTRWAKAVLVVYPLLTLLVVVTTGNHFVLDAIAGAALVVGAEVLLYQLPRWIAGARSRSDCGAPVDLDVTSHIDPNVDVDVTGNAAETDGWLPSDDAPIGRVVPAGRPSDP
jgi:hypothetical protein